MKLTKKIFAMLLCLTLVLSMATTAFAATVINETDHSYDVYQIFSGTQADGSVNLGNVKWGNGVDGPALLADLQAQFDIYDACVDAAGVANILAGDGGVFDADKDAKAFANIAAKHLTNKTATIAAGDSTVDLPTGYYLLVDVTEVDGANDANNPALLQVTNAADVKIAKKYTVPSVDKKILIENGGTVEKVNTSENSVGDVINFELKAVLPNNLGDYDEYKLVFHDKMSAGLTFDDTSVVVYDSLIGAEYVIPASNYTLKTTGTHDANCTFEIIFEDLKQVAGIASDDVIYVRYSATLNEDAVIDGPNPNEVYLEFSNDPNWVPPTPDSEPPTGETPPVEVKVLTTEVEIVKKDGTTKKVLTGAEFQIIGEGANIVIVTTYDFTEWTEAGAAPADYEYWKLTNGTYTKEAPNGDSVHDAAYASTTAKYKMTATEELKETKNSVDAKAYVGEDGRLKFSGLGVGTYTIKETKTPAGYNTVADITLHITFVDGAFQYTWSGGATGATNSITVNNYQGSTLPETGGMGTTLFYTVGGMMVLAAVVLLVTKKRMGAAE